MAENKKIPWQEGMKELGRVILLAMIPVMIDVWFVELDPVIQVGMIAGLRAIEKYLHQNESRVQLPF